MIDTKSFWSVVFMLTVGTFAIRFSFISISSKVKISDRTKEIFSFIPASILPAFIGPAVFYHQGHVAWIFGKERLIVLLFAALVCYLTRSTLATIAFGMISLFLIS